MALGMLGVNFQISAATTSKTTNDGEDCTAPTDNSEAETMHGINDTLDVPLKKQDDCLANDKLKKYRKDGFRSVRDSDDSWS